VPGDSKYINGVSYFVADVPGLTQLASEIKTTNSVSAETIAKLQSPDTNRVEQLNAPNADVISVLSGWKTSTWAVPTVAQELRLMGHEKVFEGTAKQPLAKTTIYYRKEAKDIFDNVKKSVPEFANADVMQNEEIPAAYNSPVVVVLGQGFSTPSMLTIYGRIARPAFNFENMGLKVNSFT